MHTKILAIIRPRPSGYSKWMHVSWVGGNLLNVEWTSTFHYIQ